MGNLLPVVGNRLPVVRDRLPPGRGRDGGQVACHDRPGHPAEQPQHGGAVETSAGLAGVGVDRQHRPGEQLGVRAGQVGTGGAHDVDGLREQVAEPAAELGPLVRREVPALAFPQQGLVDRDDQFADLDEEARQQRLGWAAVGQHAGRHRLERGHLLVERLLEDVVLVAEVTVEGGPGEADRRGDVVDADVVVAVLQEQPRRRGQHLGLAVGPAFELSQRLRHRCGLLTGVDRHGHPTHGVAPARRPAPAKIHSGPRLPLSG